MAKLRTEEEKEAIVSHCVELEKEGGDILGYLWSENYLTPRATWCNFQREWLGRKPYEYTDGKPTKKGGKRKMHCRLTQEDREKAIQIAIDGGDPRPFLQNLGSQDPNGLWINIRHALKKDDPETWAKLPARLPRTKYDREFNALPIGKGTKNPPEAKTAADAMDGMQEAADTFFGECEKMGLKMEQKPKITQPLMYDGYTVRCIECKEFGRFYWDPEYNHLDWTTAEGDEISFTPEGWKMFMEELPKIMNILGVQYE